MCFCLRKSICNRAISQSHERDCRKLFVSFYSNVQSGNFVQKILPEVLVIMKSFLAIFLHCLLYIQRGQSVFPLIISRASVRWEVVDMTAGWSLADMC